jgi:hypothetical protein
MKAIRIHKFGSTAEALQYEEIPIPEPRSNQLLIKVEAASLNRADLALTKGTYRIAPEELPEFKNSRLASESWHTPAREVTQSTRSPGSQRLCQFPTALTRQPRQRCLQYFSPPGSVC